MLPYWYYPTYSIGPLTLQTWGTFVALGIFVAVFLTARRAKRAGFPVSEIWDLAFSVVLAAFVGARLGYVFFYDWGYFGSHLSEIPKFWQGGFSSFGGFIGAIIPCVLHIRHHHYDFYRYGDLLISGVPLGWAIGRVGCFLIHDHPGTLTHFLLGVKYPDGIRHDLGLYDGLSALGLAIALLLFRKSLEKRPGMTIAVVLLWYGTVRFFLDFLRAFDTRYLGLTPAQYGSVVMVVGGIVFVTSLRGTRVTKQSKDEIASLRSQ